MKVIIAGSREHALIQYVEESAALFERIFGRITNVVSGCAPGADLLGEQYAINNSIPISGLPADWKKHGHSAGPIRNGVMAQQSEGLIAIWDDRSPGTFDMITKAERRGLCIVVYHFGKKPHRFEVIKPRTDQQPNLI